MTFDTADVEAAVKSLLSALPTLADDAAHLVDTPARVAASLSEQLRGYDVDPREHLRTVFPGPADPGLVVVSGIAVQSTCAHHLLPFGGRATIAYRPHPGDSIVGLSKLPRVLHGYARRLQVQERLGAQTASAIGETLIPLGVAVVITARHDCMRLRGVCEPDAETTTVATWGALHPDDVQTVREAHRGR